MVGILGDVMIDQLASIRDYPEEGSETIIRSLTPRLGGSACNTAMVLSDLVGRCLLFSQIGDDEHGHLAVATLMKKGVNLLKTTGQMDIMYLGIGHNGHIGFNEPDEFFEPYTHIVKLTEDTIESNKRFFDNIESVPKTAITMGIKTIMSAKKIILLASGESKAEAILKTVKGKITPRVPASILQLHNDVTLIIDKDAAKFL